MYDQNFESSAFQFNSIPAIVSGTYLLWVCWLFFNGVAGKTLVYAMKSNVPQVTIMNTIISGSTTSLVVFYLLPYFSKERIRKINYNPVNICNGLLSGLVSITASCNNIENYASFIIGLIGAAFYIFACRIMETFNIDDPCSASQIHAFCGLWGVLAVGFFDKDRGLLYTGNFHQLGI